MRRVSLILSIFFMVVACQTVPYTHRKALMLIPPSIELQLGLNAYQEILHKSRLSHNPRYVSMVRRVGRRIARAAHRPDYKWEFNVIKNDKVINAFCLPGGKIAVYTGLMKLVSSDAELATVIGHEVGHAIARHGAERMSQLLLVELGGIAIQEALKKKPRKTLQLAMIAYGVGTTLGILLPYSRLQEYEADRIGLILMAKAGYDPHAALSFWNKMYKKFKGKEPPEFLSTHPLTKHRIARIKKLIPEAMRYYRH